MPIDEITLLEDDRILWLCLFQDGTILQLQQENGYNVEQLYKILFQAKNLLKMMYYPQKYRDMFYAQLSKIAEVKDEYTSARKELIRDAIATINELSITKEYYRSFVVLSLTNILGTLEETPMPEGAKALKIKLLKSAIENVSNISSKDDPNGDKKRTIYNDVRGAITADMDLDSISEDDPRYEFACVIDDAVTELDKFKDDGFGVYRAYLDIRKIPYEEVDKSNLDTVINVLIVFLDFEGQILTSHTSEGYFIRYPEHVKVFIDSSIYYGCIRNLINDSESLLYNETFIDTVRNIFAAREDVDDELRKELAVVMTHIDEDCFTDCEDFAVTYSRDRDYFECIKRILKDFDSMQYNEIFIQNVRHVISLNKSFAKKLLGRKEYKEITK